MLFHPRRTAALVFSQIADAITLEARRGDA
jgi:hypothetical protein